MYKLYFSLTCIFLISCSTRVQYVGSTYAKTNKVHVLVTESALQKPYIIMGQGYIKRGGLSLNWNKVQKSAVKKAKLHGADGVLIVQRSVASPMPGLSTRSLSDSIGKSLLTTSRTETYFPVSTWHEILFLKYQ